MSLANRRDSFDLSPKHAGSAIRCSPGTQSGSVPIRIGRYMIALRRSVASTFASDFFLR